MVLLGNSTQTNCSRSNSVVSLSGKEQISPVLLLSDNAPDNHNEIEQSRLASETRISLRTRKKPSIGENPRTRSTNGFVDVKEISGKQTSPVTNNSSSYFSLVEFLSKTPCNPLPVQKKEISSLWTCGQCCQTFLSNSDFQAHLRSHNTMSIPSVGNKTKSVIASNKKRQSSEEPVVRKRLKRSSSPDQCFVFNADNMQEISSSGEFFYKCDICDQLYATSDTDAFKIHYLRSHINYQFISSNDRALCSIVDDGLKSKVTDFLYRCYVCNISCAEKKVLIEHNTEHKNNVFRCDLCHSVFYQNKAFTNHIKNCSRTPRPSTKSILCLHCKEPTWFEDRDIHTREYHCYVNGIIRVECVYGCGNKIKKLPELYKHYTSVHKDLYFSCTLCKIRFVTANELSSHNKTQHNIQTLSGEAKKHTLALPSKSDVNHVPKRSKLSKPTCDATQTIKPTVQTVVKSNTQAVVKNNIPAIIKPSTQAILKHSNQNVAKITNQCGSKPNSQTMSKPNNQTSSKPSIQTTSSKPNNQASSKLSSPSVVSPPAQSHCGISPQQQHFQDILFKSILKIDLIEQVHVLKKHATQYPGMLSLPQHPVFTPDSSNATCNCPAHGEEEFKFPVFSSSQENNVYICKACGLECMSLREITTHFTSAHPYIHNEYFVFNREDLPKDFWNLSHLPEVKVKPNTTVRSSILSKSTKSISHYRCSCCAFECKESTEFHKHLLQCAKKQKITSDVHIKSKTGIVKKAETPSDCSRRRMAITGVLRQVPDDILFSYKKKLEKTMRKPGDSETVFNMLNKLPSKRLVKTTERYDSLYYKNNKAMKPKRSSMEKMAQAFHEKDPCFSLSDYLKYFIHHETPPPIVKELCETKPLLIDKSSNEFNKVLDKKIKVVKSNSNEELNKLLSDKKIKVAKTCQAQSKDTKIIGDKKAKSPKLSSLDEINQTNSQLIDNKKLKVPKSHHHLEDKKSKMLKHSGAIISNITKLNAVHSLNNKLLNKVDLHKESSDTDMIELSTQVSNDMTCKSMQNVKVVPIHYPTLNNIKLPLLNHTKCKALKTNKSNKNILVEKKGKNLNEGVRKKGKSIHQVVRQKLLTNKNKNPKVNGLIKFPNAKTKVKSMNFAAPAAAQQELSPRKKKTTRIVMLSDKPLLPLAAMKKEKDKRK